MIWLLSDSHLYHDKMPEFCGRPVNHTELILQNWRDMVLETDTIIHLGDVTWESKLLERDLASLPGKKILVRGNHDEESHSWYMSKGFALSCDSFNLYDHVFTHEPLKELPVGLKGNVCGHLHNNPWPEHGYTRQPWHKLFVLENTDYKPVKLFNFIFRGNNATQEKK